MNNKNLKNQEANKSELKKEYSKPAVTKYADLVDITGRYQRQPCKTSSC